jgi:DNA-binding MarR family transcriptional regulator
MKIGPQKQSRAVRNTLPAPDRMPEGSYFTDAFLPYLLNKVANRFNRGFSRELRQYNISVSRWRTLAVICSHPGLSLNDIVEQTAIDQTTLSRVVDQLVSDDLVVRAPSGADARVLAIRPTGKGEALFRQLWPVAFKHYRRGVKGLGPDEEATLTRLLQKLLSQADPD